MLIPSRASEALNFLQRPGAAGRWSTSLGEREAEIFVLNSTMTLGLMQRIFLALVIFDIPFHVDINLAYDQAMSELNALGGLELSLTSFGLLGLYLFWFVEAGVSRFRMTPSVCRVSRWLLLYLAAVGISALYAPRRDLALFLVHLLAQSFLLYLFVVKKVRNRGDIVFVATTLITSLLVQSLVMIGLVGIGREIQLGPWNAFVEANRVGGTVGHPNTAASFVELLLAPALAMAVASRRRWISAVGAAAFLTGSIALVLTFSRGGWLAGAVSIPLFTFVAWRRGWISFRLPLAMAVCFALAALLFAGSIADSLLGEDRATASGRFAMIELARRIINDQPVLGVGANNYAVVMGSYIRDPDFTGEWLHVVHNRYLLIWAESGLVAVFAFVGFLLSTVFFGWQASKSNDSLLAALGIAFASGIVGQMLHMHLDLVGSRPLVQLLWVVCALVAVIQSQHRLGWANGGRSVAWYRISHD